MNSGFRLILIRHGAVDECCKGICYGQSDIELSKDGKHQSCLIAQEAASWSIDFLYHSNMKRTRYLAELISKNTGILALPDERLRERHFGQWEMRSWESIYNETGDAMNGFIYQADSYSPPGGETTFQLRDRILSWYKQLPATGTIVAVTHGGTIAALLGTLGKQPVIEWLKLIPERGGLLSVICDGPGG